MDISRPDLRCLSFVCGSSVDLRLANASETNTYLCFNIYLNASACESEQILAVYRPSIGVCVCAFVQLARFEVVL